MTGDATARTLELTAIAAGSLTTIDIETGATSSHGSGAPRLRTERLAGPVDVPAGGATPMSRPSPCPRAPGSSRPRRWPGAAAAAANVRCGIVPIHDQSQLRLSAASHVLRVLPMAWQGSMTIAPPGDALRLRCESIGGAAGTVRLESIRMTAFEVTAPLVRAVPPAPPLSAAPAQLVFHDAEQRAHGYPIELTLPNRNWAILATGVLEHAVDDASGILCGVDIDYIGPDDSYREAAYGSAGSELSLAMTRATTIAADDGTGSVRLTCDVGLAEHVNDFLMRWVRISAIRATSLGRQDL